MFPPRWLPQKSLPPYAYLPGKNPHPVRDPTGHSYHVEPIPVAADASLGSDAFLWALSHQPFLLGCTYLLPDVGFNKVNGLENQLRTVREPLLARCDNAPSCC